MGREIAGNSFAHELVLVKFDLQTHTEHLSSCRSGFLLVFVKFPLVSAYLLFNANSAIYQLYHGENKLILNEMVMRSALL